MRQFILLFFKYFHKDDTSFLFVIYSSILCEHNSFIESGRSSQVINFVEGEKNRWKRFKEDIENELLYHITHYKKHNFNEIKFCRRVLHENNNIYKE